VARARPWLDRAKDALSIGLIPDSSYLYHFLARAPAWALRLFEDEVSRIALRWRFEVRLTRPEAFRVDFREGFPVAESSSTAPPLRAVRFETFLVPLLPPPTFRSLALTPGWDVSTGKSRRGRGGRFFAPLTV
jgi:hypothetical protein